VHVCVKEGITGQQKEAPCRKAGVCLWAEGPMSTPPSLPEWGMVEGTVKSCVHRHKAGRWAKAVCALYRWWARQENRRRQVRWFQAGKDL